MMYMNQKAKLSIGRVLRFEFPITNLEYIGKFGTGFHWHVDVNIFDEPVLQRRKCEAYCSVDGSKRKYYIMEFYINESDDIMTAVEAHMTVYVDLADWEAMVKDIETDAESYWDDVAE